MPDTVRPSTRRQPFAAQRLAALHATGLLDSPPEPAFDRLTRIAAAMLRAPVSLVSLVDADRQFFKSASGLPASLDGIRETPLSHSFCQHVAATGAPLVIEDARAHPLVLDNPAIAELGVVAYLGTPLTVDDRYPLGSLCVIDYEPRAWSPDDLAVLTDLAALVMDEVSLGTARREWGRAANALRNTEVREDELLRALPVVVYRADPEPPYAPHYVSPAAEQLLGYPRMEWLGADSRWVRSLHEADRDRVLQEAAAGHASGAPLDMEYRMVAADGSLRWVQDRGAFVRDAAGRALVWQGVMLDVTERKAAEEALHVQGAAYRLMFDANPHPMWVFDEETLCILTVNDAAVAQYGYSRDEFLTMTIRDLRLPEDLPLLADVLSARRAHDAGLRVNAVPFRHRRKDGSLLDVDVVSHTIVFAGRRAVVVLAQDQTARRAAEAALAVSEQRLQLALAAAQDGLWDLHVPSGRMHMSPRWLEMLGYAVGELPERISTLHELLHEDDAERFGAAFDAHVAGHESHFAEELRLRAKEGGYRWVLSRGHVVERDAGGGAVRMVGTHVDVTERKALEAEFVRQARQDSLTGLGNRTHFRDRVGRALAREGRQPDEVAVLFLDLDDFKAVNDSLGHAAGDRLLVAAAERLLNATRGSDTVARLGGDEFAMLMENVRDDVDATIVAERITAAMRRPFCIDGTDVHVGASIGIARAREDESTDDVLRNADLAMYHAKGRGKGCHELFAPAMHTAAVDRLALAADLRTAIERAELTLAYQPVVSLETGRTTGVEALARWAHPVRGFVSPAEFIPVAESTGSIVELGRWVLAEACREAATWPASVAGDGIDGPPSIAVNVSARQLQHADFVDEVAAVLDATGLPASRLVLEVTESVLVQDAAATLARLEALKTLGVRLAIDDFGTGYSSLAYLQKFPVDVLKIDKAFVDRIARGGTDAALARTIIALGDSLGLRTVAEGVEREDQRAQLLALGCALGQGYLFSRPLGVEAIREWVAGR